MASISAIIGKKAVKGLKSAFEGVFRHDELIQLRIGPIHSLSLSENYHEWLIKTAGFKAVFSGDKRQIVGYQANLEGKNEDDIIDLISALDHADINFRNRKGILEGTEKRLRVDRFVPANYHDPELHAIFEASLENMRRLSAYIGIVPGDPDWSPLNKEPG